MQPISLIIVVLIFILLLVIVMSQGGKCNQCKESYTNFDPVVIHPAAL